MDRSLRVFLAILLGVGGVVILLNTWLIPAVLIERITMTLFAVVGWACAWLLY